MRALVAASLLAALLGISTPIPLVHASDFTVDNTGDASDAAAGNGTCATAGAVCTLRAAIEEAEALGGTDAISFSVTGTITLGSALPTISESLTITGPGSGSLTVSGANSFAVFTMNGGGTISIQNSIVQSNDDETAGATATDDCDGTVTSAGGNVVGSGTGCPSNGGDDTTSPANLGSLADNDGSTQSHFPGASSAAINRTAFGTRGCGSTVTDDQRSVGRPKPIADSACDSGSVEISTNYPIANDDSFDVDINSDSTFDVLGNDLDPEGASLKIKDVTTPSHGTKMIEDNKLRYIPTTGYFGPDSVTYTADDGSGGTATAVVSISVEGGGVIRGTVVQ